MFLRPSDTSMILQQFLSKEQILQTRPFPSYIKYLSWPCLQYSFQMQFYTVQENHLNEIIFSIDRRKVMLGNHCRPKILFQYKPVLHSTKVYLFTNYSKIYTEDSSVWGSLACKYIIFHLNLNSSRQYTKLIYVCPTRM
jgi:hypothetical protein